MNDKPKSVKMGAQIIDIVTTGMYSNPLMVVREYVQNAVDAIDLGVEQGRLGAGEGAIDIHLDGGRRCLVVRDNGVGVSNEEVEQVLCALGSSTKTEGRQRGFRGVGRLGGVGYCERVCFETRSLSKERVAVIEWDGISLRKGLSVGRSRAEDAVRQSVQIGYRKAKRDDPEHFFQVSLIGVQHFHKDELMNVRAMSSYLGQVAPVGYDRAQFSFADQISEHLQRVDGFTCYRLLVNGRAVHRPYRDTFEVMANRHDKIRSIELIDFRRADGSSLGRGWYARTGFLASLPARVGMRGIRVRQGNIEIGDEYFLTESYAERRFSTWHIGEILLGYSLKANARRDGFEQSPDYETFLEQADMLGAHLSHLCRRSSKDRSGVSTAERLLERLESVVQCRLYADEQHFHQKKQEASRLIARMADFAERGWLSTESLQRLSTIRARFVGLDGNAKYLADALDGRILRHKSKRGLLRSLAKAITGSIDATMSKDDMLLRVFGHYLKPTVRAGVAYYKTKATSKRRNFS